jgi:hypothetical protein
MPSQKTLKKSIPLRGRREEVKKTKSRGLKGKREKG